MKLQKQLGFQILENKSVKHFGGSYLKWSHAKNKRPIDTKNPMHLVLRSSIAKGSKSFLKKERVIQRIILRCAKKSGVKVYDLANGGNHLHLIILPLKRQCFHRFIRSITGLIAREVLQIQRGTKGSPKKVVNIEANKDKEVIKFWDQRPFTRIINWGKSYRQLRQYLLQNTLEAYGFIPYKTRQHSSQQLIYSG